MKHSNLFDCQFEAPTANGGLCKEWMGQKGSKGLFNLTGMSKSNVSVTGLPDPLLDPSDLVGFFSHDSASLSSASRESLSTCILAAICPACPTSLPRSEMRRSFARTSSSCKTQRWRWWESTLDLKKSVKS